MIDGYVYSHHHCWPVTRTTSASLGVLASENSVDTVSTAIGSRITADATVKPISTARLPWLCGGMTRPGRSRNFHSA